MATRLEISTLLGSVAESLGKRRGTLDHLAKAWAQSFEATPLADLRRVVDQLCEERPNRAPTLLEVRAALAQGSPKRGRAEACGRCIAGLREVAIRAKRGGIVETVVRWAHCDCDAGAAARLARAGDGPAPPTVAELAQRAKAADPLAEVYVDPTPDQRRTTAEIEHEKTRRDADRQRQDRAIRWTQAALRVAAHHGVTGKNPHAAPRHASVEDLVREVGQDDGVPW